MPTINQFLISLLLMLAASAHAQVTNFANFRPVLMTIERTDGPEYIEQGVFIRFTSDIGRIYRLETSENLTNWTLLEQVIGTDTNMSFFVPITNMTVISSGGTNGGNTNPPPGFNFSMMARGEGGGLEKQSQGPPLPYPWEPFYQPEAASFRGGLLQSLGMNSSSSSLTESSNSALVAKFYKVVCPEDRIQFPEFEDFTEQYLYFSVWTSIKGRYEIKLYQDSTLLVTITNSVPNQGYFGVHDPGYDPAFWPYTGFYSGSEFRVEVSVIDTNGSPSLAEANPAQAVAKKKIRRRNTNRTGITVWQYGAIGPLDTTEDVEFENYMHTYFMGNISAIYQIDLQGGPLNEFTDRSGVPRIFNTNQWTQLKSLLYGPGTYLTDMYYFGHGGPNAIGSNGANAQVLLSTLTASLLKTNPMFYVFLDGCTTAKEADLIKAFIGYGKKVPRQTYIDKGFTPAFGLGWKKKVDAGYLNQGTLNYKHFDFVSDFYQELMHRDFGGYLDNTFQDAINFARQPNGQGADPNRTTNDEYDNLNWFGCFDCYFDQFGP